MHLLKFLSSIISLPNKIAQLKIPQHSHSAQHNSGFNLQLAQNLRSCLEKVLPRKEARNYQAIFFPALHRALESGIEVAALLTITFDGKKFRAHPQKLIALQAQALGIRHFFFNANKPYLQDYRKALRTLIGKYQIEALVTGDLWLQSAMKWTKKVIRPLPLELVTPLWGTPTNEILNELTAKNFKPMISCVTPEKLQGSWVGKTITSRNLQEFKSACRKTNTDICGENGEFHTIVLDAPLYKKKIKITKR